MLSQSYISKIQDIILPRLDCLNFEDLVAEEEVYCEKYDELAERIGAFNYHSGASKIVFSFSDFDDIVVKVPFFGARAWVYEEEGYKEITNFFSNAPYSEDGTDYCETETYYAGQAIFARLDSFFALTYFLGKTIKDIPIYVSEKVIPGERPVTKKAERSKINAKSLYKTNSDTFEGLGIYSASFFIPFIESYGFEKTEAFTNFLIENDIGDLHSQNVGYTKDGKIKVIDYSNFCD